MSDHNDGINEFLDRVHQLSKELPSDLAFLEVGCNQGDTTRDIIERINGHNRWMFSVDPYGGKPYLLDGNYLPGDQTLYNDETYRKALKIMVDTAEANNVNFAFYRMTSLDFFKMIDKIEFWDKGEKIKPKFGFVFLDGAHEPETVKAELDWCHKNMDQGLVVVDDWHYVNGKVPYTGEEAHDRCYIRIG
jgi:hypothetical protein